VKRDLKRAISQYDAKAALLPMARGEVTDLEASLEHGLAHKKHLEAKLAETRLEVGNGVGVGNTVTVWGGGVEVGVPPLRCDGVGVGWPDTLPATTADLVFQARAPRSPFFPAPFPFSSPSPLPLTTCSPPPFFLRWTHSFMGFCAKRVSRSV
jgi:hypothetical protein